MAPVQYLRTCCTGKKHWWWRETTTAAAATGSRGKFQVQNLTNFVDRTWTPCKNWLFQMISLLRGNRTIFLRIKIAKFIPCGKLHAVAHGRVKFWGYDIGNALLMHISDYGFMQTLRWTRSCEPAGFFSMGGQIRDMRTKGPQQGPAGMEPTTGCENDV